MEDVVLIREMVKELGMDKANLTRYARKKGIEFDRIRSVDSGGQQTLCLPRPVYDRLLTIRKEEGFFKATVIKTPDIGIGWFYIIQLLPNDLPHRIKFGYTVSIEQRIMTHRTTCPELKVLASYKIKALWERTLIDMITHIVPNSPVSGEVFNVVDIDLLVNKVSEIMRLLPTQELN